MANLPSKVAVNGDTDDDDVRKWKAQIKAAEKHRETWVHRCEGIIKRYRDQRGVIDKETRRFNILWSNIQTMRPALYGKAPTAIVERRFLDRDDIGRVACQILERTLRYQIEDSRYHMAKKKSVLDYLLVGQGTAWVRYEAEYGQDVSVADEGQGDDADEDGTDDKAQEDGSETEPDETEPAPGPSEHLTKEGLSIDYVHWKDFLTSRGRVWEEVEWCTRRVYMGEDELEKRFGEDIADQVTLDHVGDSDDDKAKSAERGEADKATVYEIWCKSEKAVYWLAKSCPVMLDVKPDPLHLENFWPCPEPLFSTLANDDLLPVPDYIQYQDQAQELDSLTARITLLQSALRVAGVYDQSAAGIQRLLDEDGENALIPVPNWTTFASGGGMKGSIAFLPIGEIASVMETLLQSREQIKKDLYEITGIADIMRGQSDPDETLGAQRLKGQFVNMRLLDRQRDVARYCRDTIRIMGEVISEHFSAKTLVDVSGVMNDDALLAPDPPAAPPPMPQQAAPQPQVQPGQAGPQPGMPGPQPGMMQPAMMAPPPDPLAGVAPDAIAILKELWGALDPIEQQQAMTEPKKWITVAKAIALLRNDKLRGFRIDIETDSTIENDATSEKSQRVEFITAATGFLKQAGEITQQHPEALPLMGKLLLFGVRGFKVGRDLEASIEEFVDQAESMAKTAQPKPNPEMIKAQTEQMRAQSEQQAFQAKGQIEQTKAQAEITKAQIEADGAQKAAALTLQAKQMDYEMKQAEHQARLQQVQMDQDHARESHGLRMRELALKQVMAVQNQQADAAQMAAQSQRPFGV